MLLFGLVHKKMQEEISQHRDIIVCFADDPSPATSQLLKRIVNLNLKAVYASGKASSAADLTASVSNYL